MKTTERVSFKVISDKSTLSVGNKPLSEMTESEHRIACQKALRDIEKKNWVPFAELKKKIERKYPRAASV